MKLNVRSIASTSNMLLLATAEVFAYLLITTPPGGTSWSFYWRDPAPLLAKLSYLATVYLWPGLLSFLTITAFQLQARLGNSGTRVGVVFTASFFAALFMITGLRSIGMSAAAVPCYVLGMALAYTMMARLYAVRMRVVWGTLRMPWPVWRGDVHGVAEINRQMQQQAQARMQQMSGSPGPATLDLENARP